MEAEDGGQGWRPRMNENVTSTISLWTGTVAAHSVGSRVTFLVCFLFFSPTSCSDHSLSVLSLSMGLQGSAGKWKMASPLVTSFMRPSFSSSLQVQRCTFPTIAHHSLRH